MEIFVQLATLASERCVLPVFVCFAQATLVLTCQCLLIDGVSSWVMFWNKYDELFTELNTFFLDAGLLPCFCHYRDVVGWLRGWRSRTPGPGPWRSRLAGSVMDPNNAWQAYYNRFVHHPPPYSQPSPSQ